jgi:hypothetical protein
LNQPLVASSSWQTVTIELTMKAAERTIGSAFDPKLELFDRESAHARNERSGESLRSFDRQSAYGSCHGLSLSTWFWGPTGGFSTWCLREARDDTRFVRKIKRTWRHWT